VGAKLHHFYQKHSCAFCVKFHTSVHTCPFIGMAVVTSTEVAGLLCQPVQFRSSYFKNLCDF